jgi:hypothetical protein
MEVWYESILFSYFRNNFIFDDTKVDKQLTFILLIPDGSICLICFNVRVHTVHVQYDIVLLFDSFSNEVEYRIPTVHARVVVYSCTRTRNMYESTKVPSKVRIYMALSSKVA